VNVEPPPLRNVLKSNHLLRCFYFNARSLKNKLAELHLLLHDGIYDIIAVSESWLDDTVNDSLLLDGSFYSVFRCDRQNNHAGGGTCIFVKSSLKFKEVSLSIDASVDYNVETVCLDIFGHAIRYRIIVCYIPPCKGISSSTNFDSFLASVEPLFLCLYHLHGRFQLSGYKMVSK